MKFLRNNGLSLAFLVLFLVSTVGQFWTGWVVYNQTLGYHGLPLVSASQYLVSGNFIEATFENWESEVLQMGLFVILSAVLIQKGSSESNPPPEEKAQNQNPHFPPSYFIHSPIFRKIYEMSLSLGLFLIFFLSVLMHLYGGWLKNNLDRQLRPQSFPGLTLAEFFAEPEFWFQSFQNWQSEFLSVAVLIVMSIYLRQKGSAQSKPVDAPHSKTGCN